MIERFFPKGAPAPRGPYSPGVRAGDFIFVSGQGPVDPATQQLAYGDIQAETRLTLQNVGRVLEACGACYADVVKVSVFLRDGADFDAMNAVYVEFFGEQKPARTTVEAKFSDPKMKIEIDCVAYSPQGS
jgi:2-iminobutanoate/2-iminopropanoate deaminase